MFTIFNLTHDTLKHSCKKLGKSISQIPWSSCIKKCYNIIQSVFAICALTMLSFGLITTYVQAQSSVIGSATGNSESVPRLSISASSSAVGEPSESVSFTITSTAATNPGNNFPIRYTVTEVGDFLASSVTKDTETNGTVNFTGGSSGAFTGTFSLALTNDTTGESTGMVTVELADVANSSYQLGTNASATVSVYDDDLPVLSIEADGAVSEDSGLPASFTVSAGAGQISLSGTIVVSYALSGASNVLASSERTGPDRIKNVVFNGNSSAKLTVNLQDNSTADGDRFVSVRLGDTSEYDLGSPDFATFTVVDDESLPRLTVAPTSESVGETDGTVSFTITSTAASNPGNNFGIRYSVTESGNFLASSVTENTELDGTVDFDSGSSGAYTGILAIPLHNDTSEESTGTVTVTLADVTNTTYRLGTSTSATVNVYDDELPELSIVANATISEDSGEMATYTVSAGAGTIAPSGSIVVNYTPVATPSKLLHTSNPNNTAANQTLLFNGNTSATLSLEIVDNDDSDGSGTIVVTLNSDTSGNDYVLSSGNSAALNVADDDSLPTLSVAATSPTVVESDGVATFTITADSASNPGSAFAFRYTISETGSFLASSVTKDEEINGTINFDGGSTGAYTGMFSFDLHNDRVGEATGTVTVTLAAMDNEYRLSTDPSGTVTVYDDEVPELIIEAHQSELTEGNCRYIDVISKTAIRQDQPITIHYTEKHIFYSNQGDGIYTKNEYDYSRSRTINFYNRNREQEYFGCRDDNNVFDGSSKYTYTLISDADGLDYTIGAETVAQFTYKDNDPPELTIAANSSVVEDSGQMATYSVKTPAPWTGSVDVNFTPTITPASLLHSDHSNGTPENQTLVFEDSDTATLTVKITDNNIAAGDGYVMVTLNPDNSGNDYYISEDEEENSATFIVVDDESLPLISIESASSYVLESDELVSFTITSTDTVPPEEDFVFEYSVTEVGSFLANSVIKDTETEGTVQFNAGVAGAFTGVFSLALENDTVAESTGTVSITLTPVVNTSYRLGTETTASVTIYDDDAPELTIDSSSVVVEDSGQLATFNVSSKVSITGTLDVNFTPVANPVKLVHSSNPNNVSKVQSLAFNSTNSAVLTVQIADNSTNDGDGQLTVTLNSDNSGMDYTVGQNDNSTITILDDELPPQLSIFATESTVAESDGTVSFTILSKTAATLGSSFRIRYTASETANYLAESITKDIITSGRINFDSGSTGEFTGTLNLNLNDDEVGEDTGTVTVTLANATDLTYRLSNDSYEISATVTIYDDDGPELTIESNASIAEDSGQKATFTITSKVPQTGSINVFFDLEVTPARILHNEHFNNAINIQSLNFKGTNKATLEIKIVDNDLVDGNGSISVSLNSAFSGTTYSVGAQNNATFTVIDDESIPLLTITSSQITAESDGSLSFKLTSTSMTNPGVGFVVNVMIEENANYLASSVVKNQATSIMINFTDGSPGEFIGTHFLALEDDSVAESTGIVTITLLSIPTNSYRLGSEISTTVNIYDDELPELSISSSSTEVNENDNNGILIFSINAQVPIEGDLEINFTPVLSSSNFLYFFNNQYIYNGLAVNQTLEFNGGNSGQLTFYIENGYYGGVVTITLNSDTNGTDYTVAPKPNSSATVTVLDYHRATISIVANTAIAEDSGLMATFTVTANRTWYRTILLNFTPSTTAANLLHLDNPNNMPITKELIFRGTNQATLSLKILDNNDMDGNGTVTVTLNSDPTGRYYYLGRFNRSASFDIIDDESLPRITINEESSEITESSGVAKFIIQSTASIRPNSDFLIRHSVTETGNFLPDSVTKDTEIESPINFNRGVSGAYLGNLSLELENDLIGESTGTITVTLAAVANTRYRLGNETSATVKVFDDDAPELSIVANEPIVEDSGLMASFTVSAGGGLVFPSGSIAATFTAIANPVSLLHSDNANNVAVNQVLEFNGSSTATLTVRIVNNFVNNGDGAITVTLNSDPSGTDYTVNNKSNATFTVIDDELPPLLLISPTTESVAESEGMVSYTVTSRTSSSLGSGFTIRYIVSESSNYLASTVTKNSATNSSINFTGGITGTYTGNLQLDLHNDSVGERTGVVTVTLIDIQNGSYRLGNESAASVTVYDDDAPELTISSIPEIFEDSGQMATFMITAKVVTSEDIGISFNLETTPGKLLHSDHVNNSRNYQTLSFNSTKIATLTIKIVDNDSSDGNGSIRVSLIPDISGTDYTVGSESSAILTIIDDESIPRISISQPSKDVSESDGSVSFIISSTSTTNSGSGLMIKYTVTETGNYLSSSVTVDSEIQSLVDFTGGGPGAYTGEISLSLDDDDVGEDTGTVTVSLATGDNSIYRMGTVTSATTRIYDDEAPELSISIGGQRIITEGSSPIIRFASKVSKYRIYVSLSVDYSSYTAGANYFGRTTHTFGEAVHLENKIYNLQRPYTNQNNYFDGGGTITITLSTSSSFDYTVGSENTIFFTIRDDERPQLTIDANDPVAEDSGSMATFTIGVPAVWAGSLDVNYTPVSNFNNLMHSDHVSGVSETKTLVFNGTSTATLSIKILDNNTADGDGLITVTLNPNSNANTYTVAQNTEATFTVKDDESLPRLTIDVVSSEIAETSDAVSYLITSTATSIPSSEFAIEYTVAETGNFLASSVAKDEDSVGVVNFSGGGSGAYTGILSLDLDNDSVGEATGTVTVSLIEVTNTTYRLGSETSATVQVYDDDSPELSIEADAPVLEGLSQTSTFTVSAGAGFVSPTGSIGVNFTPTANPVNLLHSDNSNNAVVNQTLNFNGSPTATLSVKISDNSANDGDGAITVALNADSSGLDYTATAQSTATATVIDDELEPVIFIAAPDTDVYESDGAVSFTVTSMTATSPGSGFTVRYIATETGNYLASTETRDAETSGTVDFDSGEAGAYTGSLQLNLHNDSVKELSGSVSVTLVAVSDSSYRLRSETSATTAIYDDDTPELSIAADSAVLEGSGQNATFTVTSRSVYTGSVEVAFNLAVTPDSLLHSDHDNNSLNQQTITFNGTNSAKLTIRIVDNSDTDTNGIVAVTLVSDPSGADYNLGSTVDASFTVVDDESIFDLNILPADGTVVESAGVVSFIVTSNASVNPGSSFPIRYTVTEVGDYLDDSVTVDTEVNDTINFNGGSSQAYSARISFDLVDDSEGENSGSVTITLATIGDYSYKLGSEPSAMVAIYDDDISELTIEASSAVYEDSGNHATFIVSAKVTVSETLDVSFTPTASVANLLHNNHTNNVAETQTLQFYGNTTAYLTVNIVDNESADGNATITVTLNSDSTGNNYILTSENSAVFTVVDDESVPFLSIAPVAESVSEASGSVSFTITSTATTNPGNDFGIRYYIYGGSSYLSSSVQADIGNVIEGTVDFTAGSSGEYTATLSFELIDDSTEDRTRLMSVSLTNSSEIGSYRLGSSTSATVTLYDDDVPELTISADSSVLEDADTVTYTISAGGGIVNLAGTLEVYYYISASPSSILHSDYSNHSSYSKSLEFNGSASAEMSIKIQDNESADGNGYVQVELRSSGNSPRNYRVGHTYYAQVVIIDDESLPTLSISATSEAVVESSESVSFNLSLVNFWNNVNDIDIRYTVEETGNFLASTVPSGTEISNTIDFDGYSHLGATATLTLELDDDSVSEATGTVTVTMLTVEDTIYRLESDTSASATIYDDESPELSITGDTFVEDWGEVVTFTVTAGGGYVYPSGSIAVSFTPTSSLVSLLHSDNPHNTATEQTIEFNGNPTATLAVKIVNNSTADGDATITVAINADSSGTDYRPATQNSTSITVIDDDSLPVISVSAAKTVISEADGSVSFELTATGASMTEGDILLYYRVNSVGTYLSWYSSYGSYDNNEYINFTSASAGTYVGAIQLRIYDDNQGGPTGSVEVVLTAENNSTYRLGSNYSASVTIYDDDAPELSIAADSAIVEDSGQVVTFTVTAGADVIRPAGIMEVFYIIQDSTDKLLHRDHVSGQVDFQTLVFNANSTAKLRFKIVDNNSADGDGSLEVQLQADINGTDYMVGSASTATVNVIDDESIPVLTIAGTSESVMESDESASFEIVSTSQTMQATELNILYSVAESGDFLDSSTVVDEVAARQVAFAQDNDGNYRGTLSIVLENDDAGEATGSVTVSLWETSDYSYRLATISTATVTVYDDDAPELTIEAISPIAESGAPVATFTVRSKVVIEEDLPVSFTASAMPIVLLHDDNPDGVQVNQVLDFGGTKTAELTVRMVDNDNANGDGAVMVELNSDSSGNDYTIGEDYSASVEVIDDEILPRLSIAPMTESVVESDGILLFQITARAASNPGADFPIRYTVTETGNFLAAAVETNSTTEDSINFDGGTVGGYTGTLGLILHDDSVAEQSGTVTLTLEEITNSYVLGAEVAAEVAVFDDDAAELTITADSPIAEDSGMNATFTVTAKVALAGTLQVNFVAEATPVNLLHADNPHGEQITQILAFNGTNSAKLQVRINDNERLDGNGELQVSLASDTSNAGYILGTESSATFMVIDDESLPRLTIASSAPTVVESAGSAIFTITSTASANTDTSTIMYSVTEEGSFLVDTALQNTVTTSTIEFTGGVSGAYIGVLVFELQDDDYGEETGALTVTLLPIANEYRLGADEEATITILDDDAPELTITANSSVAEDSGNMATFSVAIAPGVSPPDGSIDVFYRLAATPAKLLHSDHTNNTFGLQSLEFNGSNQATLTIRIVDNDEADGDGAINISLFSDISGQNYFVGSGAKASFTVLDDESLPRLTIAAASESVIETAATAIFNVTSTAASNPGSEFEISYSVVETGSFLSSSIAKDTAISGVIDFDQGTAGGFTGTLTLDLIDDTTAEPTGEITVSLVAVSKSYRIGEESEATVKVYDDEVPELAIEANAPIAEDSGLLATFTVTAKVKPAGPINVNFTPSSASSNLLHPANSNNTSTLQILDFNGGNTATLFIVIIDNEQADGDGVIKVVLNSDQSGLDYTVGPNNSSTIKVYDDESYPVLTPENSDYELYVLEDAGEIEITLNLDKVSEQNITFTIESRDGTASTNDYTLLTQRTESIAAGDSEFSFSIQITDDEIGEPNESFTVEISNPVNTNFGLPVSAPEKLVIVVNIVDDDTRTIVSLEAAESSVEEGENIELFINSNPFTTDMDISIRISQQGNVIAWGPTNVKVESEKESLLIPTLENTLSGDGGQLTLTILPSTTNSYYVHPDQSMNTVRVIVNDDDEDTNSSQEEHIYSVVESVIEAILSSTRGESTATHQPNVKTLKIVAIDEQVEEGMPASFEVSASDTSDTELSIGIRLSASRDFLIGYKQLTVTLPAGKLSQVFTVATADDAIAGLDETLTATIQPGIGYALGPVSSASVRISDETDRIARNTYLSKANETVLPEFAGTSGALSLRTTSQRAVQNLTQGTENSFELGGQSTLKNLLQTGGASLNSDNLDWQEILGESSFSINLHPESNNTKSVTIWGIGDNRKLFGGNQLEGNSVSGDAFTGHIGIDTQLYEGLMVGFATSIAKAEAQYGNDGLEVSYLNRTSGVHPYVSVQSADGQDQLHAVAGYGLGEIELGQNLYNPLTLQSSFYNLGLSGSSEIYSGEGLLTNGTASLKITGDSWLANMHAKSGVSYLSGASTDANYLRLVIETEQGYELSTGNRIRQTADIGIRRDGRDKQSFIGIELRSGLNYLNPIGFSMDGKSLMLLEDSAHIRTMGLSGLLKYDHGNDMQGLLLNYSQGWGASSSDSDSKLWNSGLLNEGGVSKLHEDGLRFGGEIGYGIGLFDGNTVITPNFRMELNGKGEEYQLGSHMEMDSYLDFELTGVQKVQQSGKTELELKFKGSLDW